MGARLHVGHRRARPGRNTVRGAHMSGEARAATASQTVGPFFHFAMTAKPNGRLVDRLSGGDAITLVIRVTDGDGQPLNDAAVEIVQEGVFGRMPTGEDGTCVFE